MLLKWLRYGRSSSSKVIEIGTNRKLVCLFVLHYNHIAILYCFRDITIYNNEYYYYY